MLKGGLIPKVGMIVKCVRQCDNGVHIFIPGERVVITDINEFGNTTQFYTDYGWVRSDCFEQTYKLKSKKRRNVPKIEG